MSDNSSLAIGSVLNDIYKINSVLGKGGFGITYLAENIISKNEVVIKEFFPKDFVSREPNSNKNNTEWTNTVLIDTNIEDAYTHFLQKFRDEIKILSSIHHINIVEILDYFDENNTVYFVMPHIEGSTLQQYIEVNRPLDGAFIVQTINALLDGLEEVHKNGIIHRDIAPNNIYITKDLNPLLLDFGAAKSLDINNPHSIPVHKDGYSAIEQYILNSSNHTKATDIYAIGATILTMISGGEAPPSSFKREQKKEEDILKNFINKYQNGYSNKLIEIVEKSMKIKQKDRFQSVSELKNILKNEESQQIEEINYNDIANSFDYHLSDDEIKEIDGNYIFTIGATSAGKSALHTALLYTLKTDRNIQFSYYSTENNEHEIIIRKWINAFDRNILPASTPAGRVQRFTIEFGEKNTKRVNFLEIAGEDIKSIVAVENEEPKLNDKLEQLLKSDKIKKYFFLLFDPTRKKNFENLNLEEATQDDIFSKFLNYLNNTLKLKNIEVLLVITKADLLDQQYKKADEYFKDSNNIEINNTFSVLKENENFITDILLFSLGEFSKNGKLEIYNNKNMHSLIQWIYKKISGEELESMPSIKLSSDEVDSNELGSKNTNIIVEWIHKIKHWLKFI
jgi:serine/threonine protein kinase